MKLHDIIYDKDCTENIFEFMECRDFIESGSAGTRPKISTGHFHRPTVDWRFFPLKIPRPLKIGICPGKKGVADALRHVSLRSEKRSFRVNSRPLYH